MKNNTIIMDGSLLSAKVKDELKCEIGEHKNIPCLAVISVGNDEASKIYINNKKKSCEQVGIGFIHIKYEENIEEETIINKIHELNEDKNINGIIVQLPLPSKFNEEKIVNEVSYIKDVDGLTFESIGRLVLKDKLFIPCTAKGILEILDYYNIDLEGKHVVIVGRSNLVSRPLFQECINRNATCTMCHSKTIDLSSYTREADVLIVACGKKYLIDKSMVKKDSVIIDVGINREDNIIYGDVNPNVDEICAFRTPVPKGVGPMTVAMLLKNTLIAFKEQNGYKKTLHM